MNSCKIQKSATISTSCKNERKSKQECTEEENWKKKTSLPELRKMQIRGTQTTLSTTMAWSGMWNNAKDKLRAPQGLPSSPQSLKLASLVSRKNPSKLSIYKKSLIQKEPYSRLKASSSSERKNNLNSPSSSRLSVTQCSEVSSDLIEVGEIHEEISVDDCVVRDIGLQSDLFTLEHTLFHKPKARRNLVRSRNCQQCEGKRKLLRCSPNFSSQKVLSQAMNKERCESVNIRLPEQSTEEVKLSMEKDLHENHFQTAPDSLSRIYDEARTLSDTEKYICIPGVQSTHISSFSELLEQVTSPKDGRQYSQIYDTATTSSDRKKYISFPEFQPTQISSFSELLEPVTPRKNMRKESRISNTTTTSSDSEKCLHIPQTETTQTTSLAEHLKQPVSPPTDVKREAGIYDKATTSSVTEKYISFPEFHLTQISSSSELTKQPVSHPKFVRKKALNCVVETRGTSFIPSLTDIPEERHRGRQTSNFKERTLSDISENLDDVSKNSTSSNSFLLHKCSSTLLTISQDNSCYLETNSQQMQENFQKRICSPLLQHYRMKMPSQSSETNPSVSNLDQNLRRCQLSDRELQTDQVSLDSDMNSLENQETAQYQQESSTKLSDLQQINLTRNPMTLDSPTHVADRKDNIYNEDVKPLEDVEQVIPNGGGNTENDQILENNNLVSETVLLFHEDMKVEVKQERAFKSSYKSCISNTRIECKKEESQKPKKCGVDQTKSKKIRTLFELNSIRTPVKYSRGKEPQKCTLDGNSRTYSTEPNTPASKSSVLLRPTTRPSVFSEISKSVVRCNSLDRKESNARTLYALKTQIAQLSCSKSDENQRKSFIVTRDRQISPFLRYKKLECLVDTHYSSIITKKLGMPNSRIHRIPLKKCKMVDKCNKNPLASRQSPIGGVTNRFLRNPEARSFATRHLVPTKQVNSKTNYPRRFIMPRNRNAKILADIKPPERNPGKGISSSIPVDSENQLHGPAPTDVTVTPQDSPNKEDEPTIGTTPHNDEIGLNTTENSQSRTSQTRIPVRDIDVDGVFSTRNTPEVIYTCLNPCTKRSSSLPEFWRTFDLPRYVYRDFAHAHKCSSLSQLDRKKCPHHRANHHSRRNQSFHSESSKSSQFHTSRHSTENDISQKSDYTSCLLKIFLKNRHSIKVENPNSFSSLDGSKLNINKKAGISSLPDISSKGKTITMSSEERMALRMRREESIRQWVLKRQGSGSLKVKRNSFDNDTMKTRGNSYFKYESKSQEIPNPATDGKANRPTGNVIHTKSGYSEDSCSSSIQGRNNISEEQSQFVPADQEKEKSNNKSGPSSESQKDRIKEDKSSALSDISRSSKSIFTTANRHLPVKKGENVEFEAADGNRELLLNSCRGKSKNDSNLEQRTLFNQKHMENKGTDCVPYTSHNSCEAIVSSKTFADKARHTLSDKAHQRIQNRHSNTTHYLKQRNRSQLKTVVPISVLTLPPQPIYSMMGYTPDGNLILHRINKSLTKEPQTQYSKQSTQMNYSSSQENHQDVLQCSSRRGGVFLPRPLPPPNHVRGLKRPVTRSSSNFENLKQQCFDIAGTYHPVKDTKQATHALPMKHGYKWNDGCRTISSSSQVADPSISEVSRNTAAEDKNYLGLNSRENLDVPERRGKIENNNMPKYGEEISRNEACQTENKMFSLLNTLESHEKYTKEEEMDCRRLFQEHDKLSGHQYEEHLSSKYLGFVNQSQRESRFPRAQTFGLIGCIENNFLDCERTSEASSEQENESSSDHLKSFIPNYYRMNVDENWVPQKLEKVHVCQIPRNVQQQHPHVYQQNKKAQVSIQIKSTGTYTEKEDRSDGRRGLKCLKEKCLPTRALLSTQRAKGVSVSSFADPTRKLEQRFLCKHRSHHSNISSQSGSKTRTSFESSSHSRKSPEGERLRNVRFITSPNSTKMYMNRNRVPKFNSPSYVQVKNSSEGKYKNDLDRQSSPSVYLHQLKSSNSKSRSNGQENVARSWKGIQCIEAEPSGFVNNRLSKVSYTIFKKRPEQNENVNGNDSVTQRKYFENLHQKRNLEGTTTLFQKNYTNTQLGSFTKDIATKSDKKRSIRDRTPSY